MLNTGRKKMKGPRDTKYLRGIKYIKGTYALHTCILKIYEYVRLIRSSSYQPLLTRVLAPCVLCPRNTNKTHVQQTNWQTIAANQAYFLLSFLIKQMLSGQSVSSFNRPLAQNRNSGPCNYTVPRENWCGRKKGYMNIAYLSIQMWSFQAACSLL